MNTHEHGTLEARPADERQGLVRNLIDGAEALLKHAATGGDAEAGAALRRQLDAAKSRASDWERAMAARASRAASRSEGYVHRHTWSTLAGAALVGVAAGVCLMLRNGRH